MSWHAMPNICCGRRHTQINRSKMRAHGEMPEWLNGAVSKTVVARMGHREFESHSLRLIKRESRAKNQDMTSWCLALLPSMSARCVDCLNEAIERCEVTGVPLCA